MGLFRSVTSYMNNLIQKWLKKKDSHIPAEVEKDPKESKDEESRKSEDDHATIGRMAAFFAHEIRNPLTSIIGFAQFLEENPIIKSDPYTVHYTSIIKEEALRMESLIQELLSLSKSYLHQDNLSIIDVKHSIEKIVHIFSLQTAPSNIQFHSHLADETYITGNASRFERALINLIQNAVEAIQENGTIEIITKKENKFVMIFIIDSGPGISPEHLEQIFYPFYTTKDEGTGIGLPICKTIIETLNGTLDIQNHPTKGAQVTVKIPQSQQIYHKS
jgi:signal transduction histidine kinase